MECGVMIRCTEPCKHCFLVDATSLSCFWNHWGLPYLFSSNDSRTCVIHHQGPSCDERPEVVDLYCWFLIAPSVSFLGWTRAKGTFGMIQCFLTHGLVAGAELISEQIMGVKYCTIWNSTSDAAHQGGKKMVLDGQDDMQSPAWMLNGIIISSITTMALTSGSPWPHSVPQRCSSKWSWEVFFGPLITILHHCLLSHIFSRSNDHNNYGSLLNGKVGSIEPWGEDQASWLVISGWTLISQSYISIGCIVVSYVSVRFYLTIVIQPPSTNWQMVIAWPTTDQPESWRKPWLATKSHNPPEGWYGYPVPMAVHLQMNKHMSNCSDVRQLTMAKNSQPASPTRFTNHKPTIDQPGSPTIDQPLTNPFLIWLPTEKFTPRNFIGSAKASNSDCHILQNSASWMKKPGSWESSVSSMVHAMVNRISHG